MPQVTHSNVIPLPKRQTLSDLCAPSREDDEALLKVIQGFEDRGVEVTFDEPKPFVSEYLTRPLRTEQEVRATRLNPLFDAILDMVRP